MEEVCEVWFEEPALNVVSVTEFCCRQTDMGAGTIKEKNNRAGDIIESEIVNKIYQGLQK